MVLLVAVLILAFRNRIYIRYVAQLLERRTPDSQWCVEAEVLNPGWLCPARTVEGWEMRQP